MGFIFYEVNFSTLHLRKQVRFNFYFGQ